MLIIMADKPGILIIYSSFGGNTEELARAIAEGAREAGNRNVEVTLKRARDAKREDIEHADALAFGTPTYYSYMSGEMKTLFDNALPYRTAFEGKPAIAFATGKGGQVTAVQSIENIIGHFGVSFVQRSDIRSAGLAVQGKPDQAALAEAKVLGRKLGDAGVNYRCGLGKRAIEVGPKP